MKKILDIARAELSSIFYSPIAWLLLTMFAVQSFVVLNDTIEFELYLEQMGSGDKDSKTFIVLRVLSQMASKLFFFIPLLTMGVIARERYSGSITLLLSSPIKISQIIFGKYLALMTYCLLLIIILLIFVFIGGQAVENVEYPRAFSAVLGVFLLMCTYVAIGVFMSCLTIHQVVAALSTLAVLGALNYIGKVGQGIPLLGDIAYWFSLSDRTQKFIFGLLTSKNVLYFIIISGMFLSFSILKLSAGRKIESKAKKVGKYLLVMAVAVVIGYTTSRPSFISYMDVTRNQINSLSATSLAIIKPIKDKNWKLTSYVNILDDDLREYGMPSAKNKEYARFEKYTRHIPNLEIERILYYDKISDGRIYWQYPEKTDEEIAQLIAKQMGLNFEEILTPDEMREIIDLEDEGHEFVQYLQVDGMEADGKEVDGKVADGKKTFLRMFGDSKHVPSEKEISAAFKRVLQGAVKIAFVTGHRERSVVKQGVQNYGTSITAKLNRFAMINQGFDIATVRLDVPVNEDVNILVLADPKEALTEAEQLNLHHYIERGGDLLIIGDVGRQAIVNPLLKELGVELMSGQLLQKTDFSGDVIQSLFANGADKIGFNGRRLMRSVTASKAVGLKYEKLINSSVKGFTAIPVLTTEGQNVWNRQGSVDLESTVLSFNPETDTKGIFTLALALSRQISGKEQHIMVLGDGDILSLGEVMRPDIVGVNGITFLPDIYKWLSHGAYPIEIGSSIPTDHRLIITTDEIISLKYLFYVVFPGLILLFGFSLLYRRKRR